MDINTNRARRGGGGGEEGRYVRTDHFNISLWKLTFDSRIINDPVYSFCHLNYRRYKLLPKVIVRGPKPVYSFCPVHVTAVFLAFQGSIFFLSPFLFLRRCNVYRFRFGGFKHFFFFLELGVSRLDEDSINIIRSTNSRF